MQRNSAERRGLIGSSGRIRTYNPPVNSRNIDPPSLALYGRAKGLLVPCEYFIVAPWSAAPVP